MKTLNSKNQKELSTKVAQFISLTFAKDSVKADKVKTFCVEKFTKDNFENQLSLQLDALAKEKAELKLIPANDVLMLNASNTIDISASDALSNANGLSDAEINHDLLSALSAIGITDSLKEKGGKSIFKKEFNNKTDRTSCRNKFQNALSVYLLHVAHNKQSLADEKLIEIKSIADKYYIAGASFKNKSDYCTDNMQADKKELISLFIGLQNAIVVD